ncbi:MAG TPA: universal stress protein [Anaerolineales bacterium]|nr:universal stress protein [Anaerolineales bacterium]
MYEHRARADFSRARRRAFWQGVRKWFSGESDALLPFDQVRAAIPIKGQRYRGLRSIPIDQIVGSMGRYHEFNRAFLPIQDHTEDRWVNIGRAHYQQVSLPPIEVYKVGEVYFVKDGNHRVSFARQIGMDQLDAYVTEIDIPVRLTAKTSIADLEIKQETSEFLEKTGIMTFFPDAEIELTLKGEVGRLFEHVDTHRYYLGLKTGREPTYEEAVRSWYREVYLPLTAEIEKEGLAAHFRGLTKTDLYLLVSEYQWLLREVYADEASREEADRRFTETLAKISPAAGEPARQITRTLQNAPWLDAFILEQEQAEFQRTTGLDLNATVPGAYAKLVRHIQDHRWILGVEQDREVPWSESIASWYENAYLSARVLIEELDILSHFPNRTETDLYLWIYDHRQQLSEQLSWEISVETAAENLVGHAREETGGGQPSGDASRPMRSDAPQLLFVDILVPFGDDPEDLVALDQALVVAQRNSGRIHGLHVITAHDPGDDDLHESLKTEFERRCESLEIPGRVAMDTGKIARTIAERSGWVDLIVLPLSHPPSGAGLTRFGSGLRYLLHRTGRPVLTVPGKATALQKLLLAYDGSPLADGALYLATGLMSFWEDTELVVVTSGKRKKPSANLLSRAQGFLDSHEIHATYVRSGDPVPDAILGTASRFGSDLIIMGGYGNRSIFELAHGSTIEAVLQGSGIPILIRT